MSEDFLDQPINDRDDFYELFPNLSSFFTYYVSLRESALGNPVREFVRREDSDQRQRVIEEMHKLIAFHELPVHVIAELASYPLEDETRARSWLEELMTQIVDSEESKWQI